MINILWHWALFIICTSFYFSICEHFRYTKSILIERFLVFFSLRNCCRHFTFSRCLSFWGVDPLNGWANRCVFHSRSRTHLTNQHHMVYFFFLFSAMNVCVCTCTYSIVYLSLDSMHSTFEMSPVPFESGRMFNDCLHYYCCCCLLLLLLCSLLPGRLTVTRNAHFKGESKRI